MSALRDMRLEAELNFILARMASVPMAARPEFLLEARQIMARQTRPETDDVTLNKLAALNFSVEFWKRLATRETRA